MMADILRQPQAAIEDMTRDEARQLTDEIKGKTEELWSLVIVAHDRKAYRALGYATWPEYLAAEFEMSRSRSYQLLDQARVIKEIQAATGEMSTKVDISEREARDIKPVLDRVTERIREEVATVAPEQARAIVDQIIKEERGKQLAVVEGQRAARTLAEEFPALAIRTSSGRRRTDSSRFGFARSSSAFCAR